MRYIAISTENHVHKQSNFAICGWSLLLLLSAILINRRLLAETREHVDAERLSEARSHYRLGVELYKNGQLLRAESEFQEAVELQPDFSEALDDLGVILDRVGNHEDALEAFRRAARSDLKSVDAGYNYAVALIYTRAAYKEAQAELERVIHLNPRISKAHYELGRVYERLGDEHCAQTQFEQAVLLDYRNAEARYSLAQALRKSGDVARAAAQMSQFERLKQEQSRLDDAKRAFRNGTMMAQQQHWTQAIEQLQKAVELNPALTVARFNLAGALRQSGDLVGGLRQFEIVVQNSRKWPDAHYELAQTFARLGQWSNACDEYKATIRQDHTFIPAYERLAEALYARGDLAGAKATMRELLRVDPSNAEAKSILASAMRGSRPSQP